MSACCAVLVGIWSLLRVGKLDWHPGGQQLIDYLADLWNDGVQLCILSSASGFDRHREGRSRKWSGCMIMELGILLCCWLRCAINPWPGYLLTFRCFTSLWAMGSPCWVSIGSGWWLCCCCTFPVVAVSSGACGLNDGYGVCLSCLVAIGLACSMILFVAGKNVLAIDDAPADGPVGQELAAEGAIAAVL